MDAHPADVDGDGDPDLVVAQEHEPNILLLNDGSGHFTDASERLPSHALDSEDIGVADFNQDGALDVVVVTEDDRTNEFYLNTGGGHFRSAAGRLPVTGISNAVVTPDLDADGDFDIVIGNHGVNVVLINDGSAHFTDESHEHLPGALRTTQDLAMGDADGDGRTDLLVANQEDNRLFLTDGAAPFATAAGLPLRETMEETREGDFGDVDGDGDLDVLFANVALFEEGSDMRNRLLLNDGNGAFRGATDGRLLAGAYQSFDGDLWDVNRNGHLDIVTANAEVVRGEDGRLRGIEPAPYRVYVGDERGHFEEATRAVFPESAVGAGFDVEGADFNGDGRLDFYLANRGSPDRLLLGVPR
jgi:hypothetical protein